MLLYLRQALLPFFVLSALACSGGESAPGAGGVGGRLTLTGSSTIAPLMSEIAQRFEAAHPGVRVDVQTGGSSRGIADAGSGLADIGMASRELSDTEQDGRVGHVFARDGVAFIVNAANPVEDLDDAALRGIFTGAITNWQELGGSDAKITVINRAAGRSELSLMTRYLDVDTTEIRAHAIGGENQQCVKQVVGDPHAITYLSVGTSEFESAQGTPIKLLRLRGVEASSSTVASGDFPLARPLILITGSQPSPLAQELIAFAMSAGVADLVREHSFVPTES